MIILLVFYFNILLLAIAKAIIGIPNLSN